MSCPASVSPYLPLPCQHFPSFPSDLGSLLRCTASVFPITFAVICCYLWRSSSLFSSLHSSPFPHPPYIQVLRGHRSYTHTVDFRNPSRTRSSTSPGLSPLYAMPALPLLPFRLRRSSPPLPMIEVTNLHTQTYPPESILAIRTTLASHYLLRTNQ